MRCYGVNVLIYWYCSFQCVFVCGSVLMRLDVGTFSVCVCVCVYSMCVWCKSVVCVNWSFIMRYMHFGCSHRWLEKP